MTLRSDEYKIIDDGIWIPRKILESWRDHYFNVSDECKRDFLNNKDHFKYPFYLGKSEVFVDLLKMFEPLEP